MNEYLKSLKKIEFVVTYECSGRCKHCFQGSHDGCVGSIDTALAVDAVRRVAGEYPIETVMTFGGESLLYPDTVCEIHRAAREMGVPRRQLITNGFFTTNVQEMDALASRLAECGVNDVLISADAFHQEHIPTSVVYRFIGALRKHGIPVRISPAWLVSRDDVNEYNVRTREVLDMLSDLDVPVCEGNVIYPEGNAMVYLGEYFDTGAPLNPYVEDPYDVRCLSFEPDGTVLGANAREKDLMEIIRDYKPE